jgi:glycosyltransferase involved in cell wall biosynthesis
MTMPEGNGTPEVSVVIPTRDRSRLLALTLHSVRWQREVDLEVVVVDDGSADDTAQVVAALADPRVRLVRHDRPRGVSAARNRGVAEAGGAWVAFLDDDDLWAPDKLARQLQAAHQTGRTWVYTGGVNVDQRLRVQAGGPPPPPDRIVELLGRYNPVPVGASNVLVHAGTLARAGAFDTQLRRTEDWDMWIRLARLGPPAWVCHPLSAYRMHPASNAAAADADRMLAEAAVLADRYRMPVDQAAQYRRAAWTCLRAGRRGKALRHYAGAVRAGDVTSAARAVAALLHPAPKGTYLRPPFRGRDAKTRHWNTEAQAWLDRLAHP